MTTVQETRWQLSDSGPGQHPHHAPWLLLPGIAGGTDIFQHQVAAFRVRVRVIVANYPADLTPTTFCEELADMLSRLGIERVSLVGTSLGAYLAVCFAASRPAQVEQLILANAFSDPRQLRLPSGVLEKLLPTATPRRDSMLARCDKPMPQVPLAALIDCEDDPVVSAVERLKLRQLYPHARVYSLSEGGHLPFLSTPRVFNQIVEDELFEH